MTRTIDTHAHVIVPELLREQAPEELWRPRVYVEPDRTDQTVELGGPEGRSTLRGWGGPDQILADQDRAGTDAILLSPRVTLRYPGAEPGEALERAQIQNAGIEKMVRTNPARVAGLGAVPLQDPQLAATELRELMGRGVLRGCEIPASVQGLYLGDDSY